MQTVIIIFMEKSSREILSENNISITNPRLLVLEELLKTKKPITIENLQKELQDEVAVSTLYRVLNDLKSIGIVNEFTNPENVTVIELSLHGDSHHHHLFCTLCGKVVDIELSVSLEQYKKTGKIFWVCYRRSWTRAFGSLL